MSACPLRSQLDQWAPLVRMLAWRRFCKGWTNGADIDDLRQAGTVGLWHAIERYDAGKGEFKAYAAHCIYKSILGEIRSLDYLSQVMRKRTSAGEIAHVNFVAFDDVMDSQVDGDTPQTILEFKETCLLLERYIGLLPPTWQLVLTMRHSDEMAWHEIGEVFGHDHSWAHHTCATAVGVLKRWAALGKPQPLSHRAGKEQPCKTTD